MCMAKQDRQLNESKIYHVIIQGNEGNSIIF